MGWSSNSTFERISVSVSSDTGGWSEIRALLGEDDWKKLSRVRFFGMSKEMMQLKACEC